MKTKQQISIDPMLLLLGLLWPQFLVRLLVFTWVINVGWPLFNSASLWLQDKVESLRG